jgi:hypothetical protein
MAYTRCSGVRYGLSAETRARGFGDRGTSTSGLGDDGNRSGRAVLGKQTALDKVMGASG